MSLVVLKQRLFNHNTTLLQVPFFVGTTAGTTVLGAFDPFQEIAAICKKHKVWKHVDGCWGAAALLSPEHRHLMRGCELSDSLAWNPHKLMGLPLQCSAFLTTHKGQQAQFLGITWYVCTDDCMGYHSAALRVDLGCMLACVADGGSVAMQMGE